MTDHRVTRTIVPLLLLVLVSIATAARAGTLTATLTLSDLPSSITLCRDSTAIAAFQADEQWQILVDLDGNSSTGGPDGFEAMIIIETTPQSAPCSPTVVALTDAVLIADLQVWNPVSNAYDDAGPLMVSVDTMASTLTVTADASSGPFANFGSASRIAAASFAGYSQAGTATYAFDATTETPPDIAISSPSGDVQQCTSPCSAAAAYYPMIDIVGFVASDGLLPAALDSVQVEFDVAGLPASMSLCRYPGAFDLPGLADSQWLALIDVDSNPTTGFQGYDTVVAVYTTPQATGCATTSAPTATALHGDVDTLDSQGNQTYVGDATITVDTASGKIIAAVPYDSPALAKLSSNSSATETASALYAQGPTFTSDPVAGFAVDTAFTDPLQDVQNCASPCGTGAAWYPQVDLVGGSIVRADRVFRAGFD